MGTNIIYNTLISAVRQQSEQLARLQEQTASGEKVIRSSDAPVEASSILNLNYQLSSLEGYLKNLDRVSSDMDLASQVLQEGADTLVRVKTLLSQAATQTYSDAQRRSIGQEIDSLLEEMVSLANTKNQGRYLFSGETSRIQPYAVTRDSSGSIVSVEYQGSDHNLYTNVAPGVEHAAALVGDDFFRVDRRQTPTFLGSTGAAPGSGTSSVRGDVYLTVAHSQTTVEGTTGIDVGESSASLDTIIGDHVLTVDVDNQLVRLDDGTFVSFDSDSADLALQNSAGEVVYVDMSGLTTASETVTVNLSSVVKMSIDDGASWTEAPDLIDNVAVEDSATGRVLFVNATGVERLGIEPIHVEGTYDIFGAMINIRDLLLNTRSLTAAQQVSLLDQAIGSVEEAAAGLTEKMTGLGSRIKAMDGMKTMLDNMTSNAKAQKAGLQNADVAQMAIDITRIQTLYQLTLSAAAKTLNISILDYL